MAMRRVAIKSKLYGYVPTLFCWNALWLLLFFVGMGVYLVVMPKYFDDWWFLKEMRSWFAGNGVIYLTDGVNPFATGIPWDDIADTIRFRISTDNGRLGNVVVLFFLLPPKWIGSSLSAVAWAYVVMASFRLAGVDWRKSHRVFLAMFLWVFCMPWTNHLGCLVYQFNYIIPSAISLWLALRIFRSSGSDSLRRWAALFFVSLVLSMWHEGFSVPFGVGLVALMICLKSQRTPANVLILCGFIAGVIYHMSIPAFVSRTAGLDMYYMTGSVAMIRRLAKIVLVQHPSSLIFSLALFWQVCKRGRIVLTGRLILFSIVSVWTAILLSWATTGTPRAAWWSDLWSVVGILRLIPDLLHKNAFSVSISWILLALSFMSVILSDIYAFITARECRRVATEFSQYHRKVYYSDWLARMQAPLIQLSMLDRYSMAYSEIASGRTDYAGSQNLLSPDFVIILPECLGDNPTEGARRVGGEGKVFEKSGALFVRRADVDLSGGDVPKEFYFADYVDFGSFRKVSVQVNLLPFDSDSGNGQFFYMKICDRDFEQFVGYVAGVGKLRDSRLQ